MGLGVFVLFILLIFQDSIRLSRASGWDSVLGVWWAGVALMFLFGMITKLHGELGTTILASKGAAQPIA